MIIFVLEQVSHKMNSYTVSSLSPDTSYYILLCLRKGGDHFIRLGKEFLFFYIFERFELNPLK